MKLRCLVSVLASFVLSTASFAEAQQPKKVSRIGYLSSFESEFESTRSESIRLALRERGHIEGQTIATEYRYYGYRHRNE